MAASGAWKAKQSGADPSNEAYVGALKWGTGWNSILGHNVGAGRNVAPYPQMGVIDDTLTQQYDPNDIGYLPEDSASVLWGYGVDTGTSDRPPVGSDTPRDNVTPNWPHWGRTQTGIPGGTKLRSHDHGAEAGYTGKQIPDEDVAQGWRNKVTSYVEDANTSDPSQYEMQTSMRQRDQTRAGSQTPEGRENEFNSPIPSRIPGMKLKVWSGMQRHSDMEPRDQDLILRPFRSRTAATGYRQWLAPNAMYTSEPMDRQVPDNPYSGPSVPATDSYGYTEEDVIPYV